MRFPHNPERFSFLVLTGREKGKKVNASAILEVPLSCLLILFPNFIFKAPGGFG